MADPFSNGTTSGGPTSLQKAVSSKWVSVDIIEVHINIVCLK